jgi:hypothetical protein
MRPGIQANCSAISSSNLNGTACCHVFQRHSRIRKMQAGVNYRGEIKIRPGTRTNVPTL